MGVTGTRNGRITDESELSICEYDVGRDGVFVEVRSKPRVEFDRYSAGRI